MNKANILIVDDEPRNLHLLTVILKNARYSVRQLRSGKMVLSSVLSAPPDLILLDILMPEIDGYEVCRQLKAEEQTRDIPVIFISALDETVNKVKAFSTGGVDYITKPFQQEEILARVETHLTIRNLQKSLQEKNERLQQEINERKQAEKTLQTKNEQLQAALDQVKQLSGLLPICANCKKIRDDEGYWQDVSGYIGDHSEAEFTHGICPDCARKLYPEFYKEPNVSS
ncbi:MAG: response regulator [bacterium]|nr:response regulator [bacterium]